MSRTELDHDPVGSTTPHDEAAWPALRIELAPSPSRIPPGQYEARSVALKTFVAFKRRCVQLDFDVYQGSFVDGVVVARVPLYFRLPDSGRLSPASKLARLFDLLGRRQRRLDRLPMNILRNKLWLIEVGDVTKGGQHPLQPAQVYSVVRGVLERLA